MIKASFKTDKDLSPAEMGRYAKRAVGRGAADMPGSVLNGKGSLQPISEEERHNNGGASHVLHLFAPRLALKGGDHVMVDSKEYEVAFVDQPHDTPELQGVMSRILSREDAGRFSRLFLKVVS